MYVVNIFSLCICVVCVIVSVLCVLLDVFLVDLVGDLQMGFTQDVALLPSKLV